MRRRIALISPKGPLYRHRTGIFRRTLRAAPLTLTTLAALIPDELDLDVTLYDEGVEDLPNQIDADLIGMTVITGSAPRAYELSRQFRSQGKPVVLGGPHVTLAPEDAAPHADAIVVGYAEETWPQLLRDFMAGSMAKRYDMARDFSLQNPKNLVFARRDLLRKSGYRTLNTFEATRGCIHSCEFCVVPAAWGRKPFQKPVSHVIDDIRRQKAKRLLFYDLNLFADPRYARELFTALIPLHVQWFGLSTILVGRDPGMVDLLRQSGCLGLLIGFESLNPISLASMNKSFNRPQEYAQVVRTLHDAGIAINGTFVFGHDTDTEDAFDACLDFIEEAKIDLPRFSLLTPFPGTPLFQRLDQEGRILTRDWDLFDGQHVVFQPKLMTVQQLLQGHERVWKKTYSWRGIMHRMTRQMPKPLLVWSANWAYRYYAFQLSRFYTCIGGIA
jgi:radical SAM superfamily enzyme YgiQ (UPF0313 family)